MMSSKEWVKNELSLSDDCLTTNDRIMLNKVLKDLEHMEQLEKENQELKKKNSLITKAIESDVSNGELFKSMAMLLQMKIEEYKKVIEIIKKKYIDIETLNFSNNFNEYNRYIGFINQRQMVANYESLYFITQEEFELLKEELCDE